MHKTWEAVDSLPEVWPFSARDGPELGHRISVVEVTCGHSAILGLTDQWTVTKQGGGANYAMIRAIKLAIVASIEYGCHLVDHLWNWPLPFRWIAHLLGCPSGLALWSAKLDERWQTGWWSSDTPSLSSRPEVTVRMHTHIHMPDESCTGCTQV